MNNPNLWHEMFAGLITYPTKQNDRFFCRPEPARRSEPIILAAGVAALRGTPLRIGTDHKAYPMTVPHAVYRIKFLQGLAKGATQQIYGLTLTALAKITATELASLWTTRLPSEKATFTHQDLGQGGRMVLDPKDLDEVLFSNLALNPLVPTVSGGSATVTTESDALSSVHNTTPAKIVADGILCFDAGTPLEVDPAMPELSMAEPTPAAMFVSGSFWEDGLHWYGEEGETMEGNGGGVIALSAYSSGAVSWERRSALFRGTQISIERVLAGEAHVR